jgi:hypothetical protein
VLTGVGHGSGGVRPRWRRHGEREEWKVPVGFWEGERRARGKGDLIFEMGEREGTTEEASAGSARVWYAVLIITTNFAHA